MKSSVYKRSNVYRMANDTIVKFIKLYRSYECLWNVSSEDYASKLSRNAAYHEISRKMRIPGFGPREVARKIKNLKSAYQQMIRRIESSEQRKGPVSEGSVIWFDLLDEFLGKSVRTPGQCECQLDNQSQLVSKESKNLSSDESSSSSQDFQRSSKRSESLADDTNRKQRKRKMQEDEDKNEEEKDNETTDIADYDSFGKYVAASLAKMPFEYAVSAETEIHNIIIKYKVYAMRKIVYPTTTTSTTTLRMKRQPSST